MKKIIIIVDPKTNQTEIEGTGNSWMDMAYLLEALGVVCQKCIDEGIPTNQVYQEVKNYFMKVLGAGYKIGNKN